MKLTISLDEAKNLHQEYYKTDFVITLMKRSGAWDVPPWSFVYGISDLGSWDGNISTDGTNFVVTKSGYVSADKVKNVYKFSRDDIESIKTGILKTTFIMNKKIPGLTGRGWLGTVLTFCTVGILGLLFKSKYLRIRTDNEYKTEEDFKKVCDNPESIKTISSAKSSEAESSDSVSDVIKDKSESVEDKLEKLANMKEKGLIDEGEFNSKKEELLKKM